ncbi:Cloroperoxidase [Dendrothele bispora CBS 962.96]|uniref:Cloroperoxidase n=1 Tax=Dendrothele bispora (strain CBS 962.96) TaxID=1314807 RepID=A0A4S8L905_DENBC|nr:Cloroperoxidase [Dendrothele bispora CBS 962.96]
MSVLAVASNLTSLSSFPPEHAFIPPRVDDSRSPCPALNALANHGFLPRDGRGISSHKMIQSVTEMYGLSIPLATTLVSGGMLCCGNVFTGIDLDNLALHNKIEHDGSLVHADAKTGESRAPTHVDEALLHQLLTSYPGGLSLDDFAHARYEREKNLKKPLDPFHAEIGHGEASLTWLLMKNSSDIVSLETLRQFYGEERFPDSYVVPTNSISLTDAAGVSRKVADQMKKLREN